MVISREQWGAVYDDAYPLTGIVGHVVIHHTAGPLSYASADAEAAEVRAIERYHAVVRGWPGGIGYNFLVAPSGRAYEGRGWGRVGAHTKGHNSSAYGICLMGNGEAEPAPPPAWAAVRGLIESGIRIGRLTASPRVTGHRDHAATACLPLDSTEILTRRGWVRLGGVTLDDEVASWSLDSQLVTFDHPAGLIEPYQAETILIDGFESTPDHNWVTHGQRTWAIGCRCGYAGSPASIRAHVREGRRRGEPHKTLSEKRWKLVRADQMRQGFRYPGAVTGNSPGLPLTDDQVRLLVWLQGDGHLMTETRGQHPSVYGAEWHLRKPRKIERLATLLHALGVDHRRSERADGTVSLRAYGEVARSKVISLLPDKQFHWGLLDLSPHQADVFLAELFHVDGCAAASAYTSAEEVNLDVVQAIATLNGRVATRSSADQQRVHFRTPAAGRRSSTWRHAVSRVEQGRLTAVSCLTTANGTLIARQRGRVVVIGNCPGTYNYAKLDLLDGITGTGAELEDDMPLSERDWDRLEGMIRRIHGEAVGPGQRTWPDTVAATLDGVHQTFNYARDTNRRVQAMEAALEHLTAGQAAAVTQELGQVK